MDTQVKKIGGSLYFHIPKTNVKLHKIKEGDIWSIDPKKCLRRQTQ